MRSSFIAPLRCAVVLSVTALSAGVYAAGPASIQLRATSEILPADGKSTTVLSAYITDDRGAPIRDGVLVRFSTTSGRLENTAAQTRNGVARVNLTASDLPDTVAIVTANLDDNGQTLAAPGQITISFTRDAEAGYSGVNWVRIEGSDYTGYAADYGIVRAIGKNGGARVQYQSLEIRADDIQLDLRENVVRASGNVVVTRGEDRRTYRALRYELLTTRGVGERLEEGTFSRWVIVGPRLTETTPTEPPAPDLWELVDISDASVTITARSIDLQPGERLQFRRATFYLDGNRTLSLPFHVMALGQESLFANQILGFGPSGLTFDFPLYYDVRPSAVGTFYVRHGARVGSSAYATRPGWALDLEHTYNAGTASDGTVEVTALTRQDWGARWSHEQRLDDRTRGQFYMDFPTHSDLFASTQLSRRFSGWTLNASASGTHTSGTGISLLDGITTASTGAAGDLHGQLYGETDPRPLLGGKHVRYTLNASVGRQSFYGQDASVQHSFNTQTVGMRLFTAPLLLGRQTSVSQSLTIGQRWSGGSGAASRDGVSLQGTVALTQTLSNRGSATLTYDYTQTPQSAIFASSGKHRLGTNVFLGKGDAWNLSLYGAKSLDQDFASLYGNMNFAIGGPWRGRVTLSSTEFSTSRYQDIEYALVYRFAGRDIALYYSTTLRRFQVDFSGARF